MFIALDAGRLSTPSLKAVAIAHETIHVRWGDPQEPYFELKQKDGLGQEDYAHVAGANTFLQLRVPAYGLEFNRVQMILQVVAVKYRWQWLGVAFVIELGWTLWLWRKKSEEARPRIEGILMSAWTGVFGTAIFQIYMIASRFGQLYLRAS